MDEHRHDTAAPDGGASLLELLVAVAIVAVLAVLVAVSTIGVFRAAREARAIANLKSIAGAEMMLYDTQQRFGVFEELFRGGCLGGQFAREAPGGGPRGSAAEAVSDGVYLFTIRYSLGSSGMTIDADPRTIYAASYRRYRMRIGRTAAGRGGGECVLLVAPPSVRSPPTRAYTPLGQ